MVEVVVGPVVDRDALRRQPVPVVEVEREQRGERRAGVVAEVVPADLAAVVGEPVGERLRLREQQHAHVLVGVAGEQHHVGGLEVFLAALDDSRRRARGRCLRRPSTLVTIACVTTPSRPVATALGMVVTAVEFLALTWQPPRLQKP